MARAISIPGDGGLAAFHLFTDAACQQLSRHQFVSAWAALLVMGDDSNLQAGLLQRGVNESLDAELLAIAYSLEYFLSCGMIPAGSQVVIHSDCQTAVAYVSPEHRPRPRTQRNIATVEHIEHLIAEHRLTIACRWVKAHQGHDTTCWRGLINGRVDREARRTAKAHRIALQNAAPEASAA